MKKLFTALLIIIYLNVNSQQNWKVSNSVDINIRYDDYLGQNPKTGYISANQEGKEIQIHYMDSISAIQMLYNKLLESQREYDELSCELIKAKKTIDASVKYFNTTPYIYPNKQYKLYIKSLKQFGYSENKQTKKHKQ